MTNTIYTLTTQFLTDNQDVVMAYELQSNTAAHVDMIGDFAEEQTQKQFEMSDDEMEQMFEDSSSNDKAHSFCCSLEQSILNELIDCRETEKELQNIINELTQKFIDTDHSDTMIDTMPARFATYLDMHANLFAERETQIKFELNEIDMKMLIEGEAAGEAVEFCEWLKSSIFDAVYLLEEK